MPDKDLVPLNGRHLAFGFPDEVVQRGLVLMLEMASVHQAQLRLRAELKAEDPDAPTPAWETMLGWAREHKDVIAGIHGDRKRDMVALGFDASMVSGQRMLDVIPRLPDSQVAVPHGILWQRQTELLRDQAGPTVAFQFNLRTRDKQD